MSVKFTVTERSLRAQERLTRLGASPKIRVRDAGGVLLAELVGSAVPAVELNGVLTFAAITSALAVAAGTIAKVEFCTSGGVVVWTEDSVSTVTVGTGAIQFNNVLAVIIGTLVSMSSYVYTEGGA